MDKEQAQTIVQIWEKVVDTQMHFNEMSVKSRQLGLTFVAATLGIGIVLISRGKDFSLTIKILDQPIVVHVSVLLILSAYAALRAVRILDLNVYHKMLRGAVTFGEDLEENYMKKIFDLEKGMTQTISHYSRHNDAGKKISNSGKYTYTGGCELPAQNKIESFYSLSGITLLFAAALLLVITNTST